MYDSIVIAGMIYEFRIPELKHMNLYEKKLKKSVGDNKAKE